MKIKAFLFFLGMITFFSESYSNNIATADTDEVVVDLNTNTLVSESGVAVKNENISGIFYKLERDPETEIIKYSDSALVNINQDTGNIKIETQSGTLDQVNQKGEFFNNFAYMNVAKSTGAEAPNDRVYFGSPYVKYENEKIYYKDGWLTTDFSIINYSDSPKKAGYHIFSKDATIEQDKQITLYDSTLFIKSKDVFPFNIPWFRANIRKNSTVPLFPTFTSSDDYGFETAWGVLYGNKGDKYRGGIAPKFADKMGFLIGRWENWYKSELGETRLDIDDLLLYSKVKKDNSSNIGDIMNYEKRNKRYRVSLAHNYSGENGNFDFKAVNSTKSMVGNLTDIMEKFDNNSLYKTFKIDRQKYDKNIGFYSLNSDLKNLGEAKDLSLKADVSLVSDKKGYGLIVYDSIDDISYGSSIDHDLYTRLSAEKDNERYKLTAKYNYLYDLDPGSTSKDLMSRNEEIGASFLDKKNGAEVNYQKRLGNDYRTFSLWEKDIKTTLRQKNVLGVDFNYVPTTIAKYEKNDYENINIVLGKYNVKNYKFSPSVSFLSSEKLLDLTKDEYRKDALSTNSRIADYNRFDNTVLETKDEKRADFNLSNENEVYNFAFGDTKTETWDRNGLFDGTYRKYENSSNFYEATIGRKNIAASTFGSFDIIGKFRQDKYKTSSDRTNDLNLKIGNNLDITENLNNNLVVELQKYSFSGNKDKEEQRLINKSNYIKVSDAIKYSIANNETIFRTSYKQAEDAYGKKGLNRRTFDNDISIQLDKDRKFKAFYNSDDRYTSKTLSGTNLKDLSSRYYGASYENKKHIFSFSNLDMNFDVKDVVSPIVAEEKINEHRLSYTHKNENNSLTLSYAQGKDKVEASNSGKVNKRNTNYSILYKTFNENEEQDFYASFSENDYGHYKLKDSLRNTDVYSFAYSYRDKRFEKEELIKYATLEYEKPQDEISVEEVEAIKNMLDRSQRFNQQFELTRIVDESFRVGNYKKNFKAYVTLEKNDRKYKQSGDLLQSLSKFEGGIKYMQNRVGVGYTFTEKADWKNAAGKYEWEKKSREHELSVFAKIGKPSEGWKIKTYAKFYDNLVDKKDMEANRKKSLDGLGVEIGKEMGFYEWAISYENKYSASTRNYEWRAGIHFTLLTFPNNSIFGFGGKDSGNKNTRPDGYFLDRPSNLNEDWK